MNTKKMIAVLAVLAMAMAAFAFVPGEDVSAADDNKIVYLDGDYNSEQNFSETQTVIVKENLVIKEGGKITIKGKLIVNEGVTVTIEGDDGTADPQYSNLTIEGDAEINGTIISKTGGEDSDEGLVITPDSGKKVVVNGTISALGNSTGLPIASMYMTYTPAGDDPAGTITVNGSVVIGTNAVATIEGADFVEGSTLTVYGKLVNDTGINLAGYAYFDGEADDTAGTTIKFTKTSAVVEIEEILGILIITDEDMYAYTHAGEKYYITGAAGGALADVGVPVEINSITFTNVKNLKITETVETEIVYDEDESENVKVAETKMMIAPLDGEKAVEGFTTEDPALSGSIEVTDGMTVYFMTMIIDGASVTFDDGTVVTIEGDVVYPLQDGDFTITNGADMLYITGSLAILSIDMNAEGAPTVHPLEDTNVTAAYFTEKDADKKTNFYYTTLAQALEAEAQDITMLGTLIVDEDITIPAPVKLTTAKVTEGDDPLYDVIVEDEATFTIADGAKFNLNGDMLVDGTFVIENIDYGVVLGMNDVFADVLFQDGAKYVYTNVYIAFAGAAAGDEIEAYNPAEVEIGEDSEQAIVIDKDLTLPAGVEFSNNTFAVAVDDGVVFTIDGKLVMDDDANLVALGNGWNDKTPAVDDGKVKDFSVIKIGENGVIEFTETAGEIYEDYAIAGAYFMNEDGISCITNIPYAFAGILDADGCLVTVAGEVSIDCPVTGTEEDIVNVNIVAGSKVTMNGFVISYGIVEIVENENDAEATSATLTGDIGTATGKIVFNKADVATGVEFANVWKDDAWNFQITGTFGTGVTDLTGFQDVVEALESNSIESKNLTSISGTVYMGGIAYAGVQTVDHVDDYAKMKFLVPAGAKLIVNGPTYFVDTELLVEGELLVWKNILAGDNSSVLSVLGTVNVPKIDSGYGTLAFNIIAVGGSTADLDYKAVHNGAATVIGDGLFVTSPLALVVFNGATVSADVLASWMEDDDRLSTEFYVDGALWATVYEQDSEIVIAMTKTVEVTDEISYEETTYNIIPTLENVKFKAWQTYDEKAKKYVDIVPVVGTSATVGQFDAVYASIDKDIYEIKVVADEGIDNVFMDGKIMEKNAGAHVAKVKAGPHTLSYTLANGYSGNAVITTIDGEPLLGAGLSFTVNDGNCDGKMIITLSGIEKSGIDVDPETHPEKPAAGLSTTEILLIVVVIIMAIMAVVLILRLNRS